MLGEKSPRNLRPAIKMTVLVLIRWLKAFRPSKGKINIPIKMMSFLFPGVGFLLKYEAAHSI